MRARALACWGWVAATGCGLAEMKVTQEPPRGGWELKVNSRLALVDERCSGPSCAQYPNPNECLALKVSVQRNGGVCGKCTANGSEREVCGGPIQGIPYLCGVQVRSERACVSCQDIFGKQVYSDCAGEPAVRQAGCYEASRPDGSPCQVCVDASQRVVQNNCGSASGSGFSDAAESPDAGQPTDAARLAAQRFGRGLLAEKLNLNLVDAGLPSSYQVGPDSEYQTDTWRLDGGFLDLANMYRRICESESDGQPTPESNNGEGWWRGTGLRCAYMGQVSMVQACGALSGEQLESEDDAKVGIFQEWSRSTGVLDKDYECVGSPLVLDLDGNGIEVKPSGTSFDLYGLGRAVSTTWISRGDALLSWDRNGNGRIDNGTELFGDATAAESGLASDGFHALSALDANHDGRLDKRDPTFRSLLLWKDDGDGISAPGELVPLWRSEIVSLALTARPSSQTSPDGSALALWSHFTRKDGSRGASCDVFFRTRPAASSPRLVWTEPSGQ